jgi:hypothetical protein
LDGSARIADTAALADELLARAEQSADPAPLIAAARQLLAEARRGEERRRDAASGC